MRFTFGRAIAGKYRGHAFRRVEMLVNDLEGGLGEGVGGGWKITISWRARLVTWFWR